MNNYLAILNFLRPFAGDTMLHSIEDLLLSLGLDSEKAKDSVLGDLARLKLIQYEGGTQFGGGIAFYSREEGVTSHMGGTSYKQYAAKITIDGLKYLKDELQLEKEGSYTVTVTGNQNQLVLGSKHVSVNAQQQIQDLVDKAIEVINETDLRNRDAHITTLRQLQQESTQGQVKPSTIREVLSIGDQVASVSGFILSILNQLQVFG